MTFGSTFHMCLCLSEGKIIMSIVMIRISQGQMCAAIHHSYQCRKRNRPWTQTKSPNANGLYRWGMGIWGWTVSSIPDDLSDRPLFARLKHFLSTEVVRKRHRGQSHPHACSTFRTETVSAVVECLLLNLKQTVGRGTAWSSSVAGMVPEKKGAEAIRTCS